VVKEQEKRVREVGLDGGVEPGMGGVSRKSDPVEMLMDEKEVLMSDEQEVGEREKTADSELTSSTMQ
jgi:hypothetical protein